MTDLEKQDMYVANCVCCTLAEAMKTCETCPFRIGLAARTIHQQLLGKRLDECLEFRFQNNVPDNIWNAYIHYVTGI